MSCIANLPDNLYYNITDSAHASLIKVVCFTLEPDVPFNFKHGSYMKLSHADNYGINFTDCTENRLTANRCPKRLCTQTICQGTKNSRKGAHKKRLPDEMPTEKTTDVSRSKFKLVRLCPGQIHIASALGQYLF